MCSLLSSLIFLLANLTSTEISDCNYVNNGYISKIQFELCSLLSLFVQNVVCFNSLIH